MIKTATKHNANIILPEVNNILQIYKHELHYVLINGIILIY